MTSTAIVAIGGRGSRLNRLRHSSKSFLSICGKPALFWTLRELRAAGIKRVILCSERAVLFPPSRAIALEVGYRPNEIETFNDPGYGVHGLPTHLDSLPKHYFFVAGHATVRSAHFESMRRLNERNGRMVFSLFDPNSACELSSRTMTPIGATYASAMPTSSSNVAARMSTPNIPNSRVLSFPYLLNREYSDLIRQYGYSIQQLANDVSLVNRADYLECSDIPEFDVRGDFVKYSGWLRSRLFGRRILT